MSDREETRKVMKRDSITARQLYQKFRYKLIIPSLLIFGAVSSSAESKIESSHSANENKISVLVKDTEARDKAFDAAIDSATYDMSTNSLFNQTEAVDSIVEKMYADLVKEKGEKITISDLMKVGVTSEDFQEIYDQNPELLQDMQQSPRNKRLLRAMRTSKKCGGWCLLAFQNKLPAYGYGNCLSAGSKDWGNDYVVKNYRGGGRAHVALENSGNFMVLEIGNVSQNPMKAKEMKETIKALPDGAILTYAPTINSVAGLKAKSGTRSARNGHIAIKEGNSQYSDGRETVGGNPAQYADIYANIDNLNLCGENLSKSALKTFVIRTQELENETQHSNNTAVQAFKFRLSNIRN